MHKIELCARYVVNKCTTYKCTAQRARNSFVALAFVRGIDFHSPGNYIVLMSGENGGVLSRENMIFVGDFCRGLYDAILEISIG